MRKFITLPHPGYGPGNAVGFRLLYPGRTDPVYTSFFLTRAVKLKLF